jgi:predicted RND superfamily exporter protein
MKPIVEFGWFAAAGVIAAWILSMSALPAVILLTKLGARPQSQRVKNSSVNKAIDRLTQNALNHPIITSSSLTLLFLSFKNILTLYFSDI